MTNEADATTDTRHGEPMPSQADPQTETSADGDSMPDQANPMNDTPADGDAMPDEVNPMNDTPAEEDAMPDQTTLFPTPTQGDPMPEVDESMADTERMLTPETAARAALTGVTCELGRDEVRVLTRIAERLRDGQDVYGQLDLITDAREFRTKEAREEVEDALVYLACAWLKIESNLEVN
jgi:hypothetical protein